MFIKVKVKASAKEEQVKQKTKDTYMISVREPAERNLANKRVCMIIALLFKVQVKDVRIISGHHNPSKILSIKML